MVTDPTLTPEERSTRQTQASITAAYRHASSSVAEDPLGAEFRVGHDEQIPLTRLDFGGEDQEKRHAQEQKPPLFCYVLIVLTDILKLQAGRVCLQIY